MSAAICRRKHIAYGLRLVEFAAICLPRSGAHWRDHQGEGSMTIMSRRPVEGIA
jgi:hypothetical protein